MFQVQGNFNLTLFGGQSLLGSQGNLFQVSSLSVTCISLLHTLSEQSFLGLEVTLSLQGLLFKVEFGISQVSSVFCLHFHKLCLFLRFQTLFEQVEFFLGILLHPESLLSQFRLLSSA